MPWLILLPLLALAGGGAWWYEKNKAAATTSPAAVAAAAASQPVGVTYQPPIAAGLASHLGTPALTALGGSGTIAALLKAAASWPVGSPQYNRLMASAQAWSSPAAVLANVNRSPPNLLGMNAAASPAAVSQAQQIATEANNVLMTIPAQVPGDPTGLDVQLINAALMTLINNPTPAQMQATIAALIQNGNQYAVNAASILKTWSPTV